MGLSRIDFDSNFLMGRIEQIGNRAIKHGIEVMEKEGEEVAKLAREFAPVDEGDLENAIRSEKVVGSGINNRSTVEVFVDPDATDNRGVRVADYGYLMHEGQVPTGDVYKLGPGSQAKDGGRGIVGGKFLERAFEARLRIIERKLKDLWTRQFGSIGSRGGRRR